MLTDQEAHEPGGGREYRSQHRGYGQQRREQAVNVQLARLRNELGGLGAISVDPRDLSAQVEGRLREVCHGGNPTLDQLADKPDFTRGD